MNYNMIAFSRHGRYINKIIAAVPYGKQLLFEKVLDSHFPEHETIWEYLDNCPRRRSASTTQLRSHCRRGLDNTVPYRRRIAQRSFSVLLLETRLT